MGRLGAGGMSIGAHPAWRPGTKTVFHRQGVGGICPGAERGCQYTSDRLYQVAEELDIDQSVRITFKNLELVPRRPRPFRTSHDGHHQTVMTPNYTTTWDSPTSNPHSDS